MPDLHGQTRLYKREVAVLTKMDAVFKSTVRSRFLKTNSIAYLDICANEFFSKGQELISKTIPTFQKVF